MFVAGGLISYDFIDSADTVGSGEVQYTAVPTEGAATQLTFNSAQASEVVTVTYITQAWRDVWENIVYETVIHLPMSQVLTM